MSINYKCGCAPKSTTPERNKTPASFKNHTASTHTHTHTHCPIPARTIIVSMRTAEATPRSCAAMLIMPATALGALKMPAPIPMTSRVRAISLRGGEWGSGD